MPAAPLVVSMPCLLGVGALSSVLPGGTTPLKGWDAVAAMLQSQLPVRLLPLAAAPLRAPQLAFRALQAALAVALAVVAWPRAAAEVAAAAAASAPTTSCHHDPRPRV